MTDDAAIHNSQFTIHNSDDLLWRQLKTIPAFRAILRAVEARFYAGVDLPAPVLDVGCGDGHFSQVTFPGRIAAGIDPWWNPLQKSARAGQYDVLAQAMGDRLPFPDNTFASAFSNSVLEHIPDIQPVLNDVNRVLQMDGRFLITMPSQYFTEWLGGAAIFEKLGIEGLADWYRRQFNGISRHAHTDSPEIWAARLAQAGFEIERWQYYFSKEALRALEVGHAQGIPAAIMHLLTGQWIVAPWESSLKWTERWLRPYYDEPFAEEGAYLLIVARKKANGPIEVALPAARPFTLEELNGKGLMVNGQLSMEEAVPTSVTPIDPTTTSESLHPSTPPPAHIPTSPPSPAHSLTPLILIGLSLVFAMLAQGAMSSGSGGLGWLALAAVPLAVLAWRQRNATEGGRPRQWPRLGDISERRWWLVPAFLLTILAYRFTAVPGGERPYLALLLWLSAISLGFFALTAPRRSRRASQRTRRASQKTRSDAKDTDYRLPGTDYRFTLLIALILFLAAVALRYFRLSQQPFVLSGIEASLGLNAVDILQGQLRNPFGSAWLTNPTLLLYLTAVPIRLFGQTVFALRFWSPLVGGLTVAATYVFGERLYGRVVGLAAAILLLGSHLHLQYSHLGMTNIWSPLLVLLALGLTAVAWERPATAPHQRTLWLVAGLATGLNAYEFTSARLLPLILLALLLWALILDRKTLRAQASHWVAALVLALIITLPTVLFYRANPTIFMERANVLGIFQTGWLPQEALATGKSQIDLLQQQFWQSVLAFNGGTDLSPAYKPNAPLLSFGTAVLFLLGFLISLFRLRQFKFALLPIWFLVTAVFAGALLLDPPQSHRLLTALPAIVLLAAIALNDIIRLILSAFAPPSSPLEPEATSNPAPKHLITYVTLLALILAFSEVLFYYGRYPQTQEFADANTEAAYEISQVLNALDGDWTAYLYGPPVMYTDFPTFPYLLTDFHKGINWFDVAEPLPTVSTPAPHQVFVFLPERLSDLTAVQEQFPGGLVESVNGRTRSPLFLTYTVPGES